MASFHSRFPGPPFNQNFQRNDFNMNPSGDRHPRPNFQRPPNVSTNPFQRPERFMHGNFQNRSPFPNFPEAVAPCTFINRQPPPDQVFRMNQPPPNQVFRLNQPSSNQVFPMNQPPPNPVFCMNQPPTNQAFCMNQPPPNQAFHMNQPPPNQVLRMNVPPPDQIFRMNTPPPDQVFRPPTPNQVFRMNSPPSPRVFRMKSPPPVPRPPRFSSGSFDRPMKPWNKIPSFSNNSKPQFPNHPHEQGQFHRDKNFSLQINKKRKQKTREFRKLKEDTTEKPFSCDTCDRAFITEDKLQEHLSQHITCDLGNCTFEAHPKIVALHKKMQHETGYADTISKLKDDEEIQKWREERRRRFPTAENIEKRKAEQAEREARGEVLETKEFGKFKQRREENGDGRSDNYRKRMRGRGFNQNYNRRRNFPIHQFSRPLTLNVDSESDSDSDSHITLKKFLGISSLKSSPLRLPISHTVDTANEDNPSSCRNQEEDLPESDSNHTTYQSVLSNAFDNSSNVENDQTPFVLNDEIFNECSTPQDPPETDTISVSTSTVAEEHKMSVDIPNGISNGVVQVAHISPADESVCEIPEEEVESRKRKHELIDIEDSDDESPLAIPIKSFVNDDFGDEGPVPVPVQKSGHEAHISPANESVCEIPEEEVESRQRKHELIDIEDSDDESPLAIPIKKSFVNDDFGDEGPVPVPVQKSDDVKSLASLATTSSKTPFVPPNVANSAEVAGTRSTVSTSHGAIIPNLSTATGATGTTTETATNLIQIRSQTQGDKFNKRLRKEQADMNGSYRRGSEFQAKKSTLLEKLLADDIRHERNIILQCIRHIVNNNFFKIGD